MDERSATAVAEAFVAEARAQMAARGVAGIPLRDRRRRLRAVALIDSSDAELVGRTRWSLFAGGYAANQHGYLHRLLLGLRRGDGRVADHRNGDRLDNRRANLRIGTARLNDQNVVRTPGQHSRERGVSASGAHTPKPWRAYASINGRQHWLGYHYTEEAAAAAVRAFRAKHMPFAVEDRRPEWPPSELRLALAGPDLASIPEPGRQVLIDIQRSLLADGVIKPGPRVRGGER